MKTMRVSAALVLATGIAFLFSQSQSIVAGQQTSTISIDADDIGGVVTGPRGPEAGV